MTARVTKLTILLLALTLVMVALLQLRPAADVDMFWQIKVGELMLERGSLPTEDSFTITHAGESAPILGWLAQAIFAAVFRLGGWPAVHVLNVLCYAAAFLVAGLTARELVRRRGITASLFSHGFALALGFLAGLSNTNDRPQSLGILCFALVLYIARSDLRLRSKVLLTTPILLFWQNCHPSVAVGVLALGALLFGEVVLLRRLDRGAATHCAVLGVLAALAMFATPMGSQIFESSAANIQNARILAVTEWQTSWHESVRGAVMPYWLAVVLTLAMLAKLRSQVELRDLVFCAIMTLLSLSMARFALFWAVAMVPIWTVWSERVRPRKLFAFPADALVPRSWFAAVMVVGLPLAVLLPAAMRPSISDNDYVSDAVARLQEVLPQGRIYNYLQWSGPLILEGHPDWRVAIDGRLYFFSAADIYHYKAAAMGKVPVSVLQERFRPDAFFLQPRFHRALVELLRQDTGWREVYSDRSAVIFLPSRPVEVSHSVKD